MLYSTIQTNLLEIPENIDCIPKYVFYILSGIIIPIVVYLKGQLKKKEEIIEQKEVQYSNSVDEHIEYLKNQHEKLEIILSTLKKNDVKI